MEDAIVTEKATKATKPETIDSCWRKLCPDVGHGIYNRANQIMKEIMALARKGRGEGYQETNFGEIRGRTDTTPENLTEDDLMEVSASEPRPDNEKMQDKPRHDTRESDRRAPVSQVHFRCPLCRGPL